MAQWVVEGSVDVLPLDLAVSPDGIFAVVRGTQDSAAVPPDIVSFWELSAGIRFFATGCTSGWAGGTAEREFSDLVGATNSRAITIGSNSSTGIGAHNQTFIDVMAIDTTIDPPAASCVNNLLIPGGTASTMAGDANDVAISWNGAYAVVSHRNWIHVISMASGAVAAAFNIGANAAGPCSPDGAVDSVAATRTRAIVTTNRFVQNNRTWVYIVSLAQSPPVILLETVIGNGQAQDDQHPHDVAVTPDGSRAVVASNGVVALFDLTAGTLLGFVEDDNARRDWDTLRDSVEINSTGTRAVVICDNNAQGPLPRPFDWRVQVFDITQATLGAALATYDDDPQVPDMAHDLAITPDGNQAVVRAGKDILLVSNLTTPPATQTNIVSTGDPLRGEVFCSDSIVTTNETAVTIGTDGLPTPQGIVDFVTLSSATKTTATLVATEGGVRCTDLALTLADDGAVAVKTVARPLVQFPPGEPLSMSTTSSPLSQDILVTLGGTLLRGYGGNGQETGAQSPATAVDSLELTISRIVTLSHTRPSAGTNGWVQVVQ
jgi:hypothetical protein